MIQRFMKSSEKKEENVNELAINKKTVRRIGSLEGQDLIDADYDIDECNNEVAEMFGVMS